MAKLDRRDFLKLVGAGGVGVGAGFLLAESIKHPLRASDSLRRAAGGVQPGNRHLVQQRVLHVPGGLRDLGAHARGASEDNSGQSVASGEPGTVVRARPVRRARVVQPRSPHDAAAAHGRARHGRPSSRPRGTTGCRGSPIVCARCARTVRAIASACSARACAGTSRSSSNASWNSSARSACCTTTSLIPARCTRPTSGCSASSTCRTTTCATRAICCPSAPTFSAQWISPVHHSLGYGHSRQGRPGVRGRFVQIEPRMSLSGAAADEWIAARPGTEGLLALGLAHRIVSEGHYRGADRDDWASASVALLDRTRRERDRRRRKARSRGSPTTSRKRSRASPSAAAQRAITPTASTS